MKKSEQQPPLNDMAGILYRAKRLAFQNEWVYGLPMRAANGNACIQVRVEQFGKVRYEARYIDVKTLEKINNPH